MLMSTACHLRLCICIQLLLVAVSLLSVRHHSLVSKRISYRYPVVHICPTSQTSGSANSPLLTEATFARYSTALCAARGRLSKRNTLLKKLLEEIKQQGREGEVQTVPLNEDPLLSFVETIAAAADKRKAAVVTAKRVFHLTEITSFVVFVEGYNVRQNQAISMAIKDDVLEQLGKTPSSIEGSAASGWIIVDYGSVMVHIMTPQMRDFYKLEKKWKDGEEVNLSHVLTADAPSNPNRVTFGSADAAEFNDSDGDFSDFDEDEAFWGNDLDDEIIDDDDVVMDDDGDRDDDDDFYGTDNDDDDDADFSLDELGTFDNE